MNELGRLLTAMVTPFDEQGDVDYVQAKSLAGALLASGSDGLVVCGTTGEAPTLSTDEKLRLLAEVRSVASGRGSVVAGTGSYDTRESQELTREAEKLGVDACLLVVPYYNRPTQEGLYQHFRAIAESTSLPCIVYNVPSRTACNLMADTMLRLARIDNIVGVKEASGNFAQVAAIIDGAPDGFFVYSGNDGDTFHVLALGGYGVISVASNLVATQLAQMIQKCVEGDTREAARLHHDLMPLIGSLFVVANPMPVKYAVNQAGFRVGKPRLPLVEPDEKSARTIRETLARYHIDVMSPST
ncbi:MAG: 4-hydroxy-tetrahydrodipicolinate synthase [Chloroflexota bacterium]